MESLGGWLLRLLDEHSDLALFLLRVVVGVGMAARTRRSPRGR